jgi:hypothetical protein
MLTMGALTPRGIERLQRLVHRNADGFGSEPNRPFVLLAD